MGDVGRGGAFDSGAFDSRAFNTAPLNTQPLNASPLTEATPDSVQPPSGRAPSFVHDGLNVSEPTFRVLDKAVLTLHVRGLIEAFQEIEDYNPQRNRPTSAAVEGRQGLPRGHYCKALIHELRRLNDLLEAGKTPDPAKVEESGSALAYAAKKISDAAYDRQCRHRLRDRVSARASHIESG